MKVRVGMEASGPARWFERLLGELQFELWVGDAAEIRAKRVRKQKTDRQGAQHILRLLLEDRFPQIWVPAEHFGILLSTWMSLLGNAHANWPTRLSSRRHNARGKK